jgi:hypothetical protein
LTYPSTYVSCFKGLALVSNLWRVDLNNAPKLDRPLITEGSIFLSLSFRHTGQILVVSVVLVQLRQAPFPCNDSAVSAAAARK